jgi:uncharacterized protein YceK
MRHLVIALAIVLSGCATGVPPSSETATVRPVTPAPVVLAVDDAASFTTFRSHLAQVTPSLGASSGRTSTDLTAKNMKAAKAEGVKLAKLATAEQAWLLANPSAECYSAVWTEWQFAMYAVARAGSDLAAGKVSAYASELADATDTAGAVSEDLAYAGANCGVAP